MKWMDMSLREFQAALSSSSPTPGGGTAAAVALGQAASLAVMVCDLTLNSEKWQDGWGASEEIQAVAIPLMRQSGDLAEKDSQAFDQVMEAFRLPKSSDSEIDVRRQAIREATLLAAEIPHQTAVAALKLLQLLPRLAASGNSNAVSDVGVAGLLASAAAKGAIFNVEINLASLHETMGSELRKNLPGLKEDVRIASRSIMDAVRDRMES
jgi:formiminotetrahydrofolate cyclodeaminase